MPGSTAAVRTRSVLSGDRIIPPTGLEVIVCDHCNIACRQCNHGSPAIAKWNVSPEELACHLGILARVYQPAYVKLIGGEPLLHPNLLEVAQTVRASGITDYLKLVTNGILLDRLDAQMWKLIDEIEISRYQSANLTEDFLARHRSTAKSHSVKFTLNDFPEFRDTFTSIRNKDMSLVDQVFKSCKIANVWGCHAVYKGRIYRCPQSIYAHTLAGSDGVEGFPINGQESFRVDLLDFLNADKPLVACQFCVGTSGRKRPHRNLARKMWSADLAIPAAEMIDFQLLSESLAYIVEIDDCKTPPTKVRNPLLRRASRAVGYRPKRIRNATSARDKSEEITEQ